MIKTDINFSKLPDAPGVYTFLGAPKRRGGDSEVLYIGKATSLRSRVRSYFDPDLHEKRSPLVAKVIADATKVTFEETDSVLEALLLEAERIKEHKPIGNTDAKDDKSFNYVVITKEEVPRVLVFRGRELSSAIAPTLVAHLFGPFTQGGSLKIALKIIRRIFPFFDTKFPINGDYSPQQAKTLRFNQSIGVYPSDSDLDLYKKSIRNIVLLFQGKKKALLKGLERDMKVAAKSEQFEDAELFKRQLFALTHIQDIALVKDEYRAPSSTEYRIEAYDTAHLKGDSPRGVMVAVVDGEPDKSQYRVFTIRRWKAGLPSKALASEGDDYEALREILTRRLGHAEWPMPKLIVIDGGRAHLKVADMVLARLNLAIETCAVVKDARHKPKDIIGRKATIQNHKASILLANAEAHRFSIGRHRRALRSSARRSAE